MLDLNNIRKEFADYLASNANKRHSLDAALMYVVEKAYIKGYHDAETSCNTSNSNDLTVTYTTIANIDKDA